VLGEPIVGEDEVGADKHARSRLSRIIAVTKVRVSCSIDSQGNLEAVLG
jgi:hypothetical protein